MIDHIAIGVEDLAASERFFVRALAPLGMRVVMTAPKAVGLGRDGIPLFWLDAKLVQAPPLHLAFAAENHAQVDAFYREALAAGGSDNGAPGLRTHYHPDYYAAFVRCPAGHNVEAVCRRRTG
jgi:catechol 2,3-dioxygenase-like lactoylglutathione lyase family enzyme